MFVHLTNRTKFLVHVRSFIKRTNINELPAERLTNCSLNVRFVYSPIPHQVSCFASQNIRQHLLLNNWVLL
ncbi:hypothetical protein Hanom_Chr02g00133251 [Helianthus anomalus]